LSSLEGFNRLRANAIKDGNATFEISDVGDDLVLDLTNAKHLWKDADEIFKRGNRVLAPLSGTSPQTPTPVLRIGGKMVIPKPNGKQSKSGRVLYHFIYAPK